MGEIKVLDDRTIDKIAAGEVIERPASVVKELVENAIDAGATSVSIEIKNGGSDFIRVTDNGSGIPGNQVRTAFLPHATSKLRKIEDLENLSSLGFRGEALPSIAAVSQVELMTKTADALTGYRYCIDGGTEQSLDEVGVPDGTTFVVRNLFYHTPARKKFLKTAMTEAGYVTELVEEMALARPDIAFKYIVNNNNKLVTTGNGELKDVVYRIFGRDITEALLEIEREEDGMTVHGYIAKPVIARSSRGMENYFVNGRYVKDKVVAKAIEDAYAGFLMQHKFPFVVLNINVPPELLDVNVHPRKMEVKFGESETVYDFLRNAVKETLSGKEFINNFTFGAPRQASAPVAPKTAPEPFEKKRFDALMQRHPVATGKAVLNAASEVARRVDADMKATEKAEPVSPVDPVRYDAPVKHENVVLKEPEIKSTPQISDEPKAEGPAEKASEEQRPSEIKIENPQQLNLFEEKILTRTAAQEFTIVGQIFDTYWIVQYRDTMLVIDQHAAHEKVNYENFMEKFEKREVTKQTCSPPVIVTLDGAHQRILEKHMERFEEMGFEIESFGGNDYAIRAVPEDLYGLTENEVFIALLDELSDGIKAGEVSVIHDKIASMSCKAAVKGNMRLSMKEAEVLIERLLELKDPYNCPHGRPTIIKMTKYELEKKFKRIL